MITFSLQSGSNGNSIYVETSGKRLLFDAGISGRQVALRLAAHQRDVREIDAVILSHDHVDHVRGAGVLHRRHHIPLYATSGTLRAAGAQLGKLARVEPFAAGDSLRFGDVRVHTLRTPHDAVDGVAFIVERGRKRLGVFTDLGHPFRELSEALRDVDAAYLESNYDPHLLEIGPYSADVKARIRGSGGHISNEEAAELLASCRTDRLRWVALAHLSAENNSPRVALATHRAVLGDRPPLWVAGRTEVSASHRV